LFNGCKDSASFSIAKQLYSEIFGRSIIEASKIPIKTLVISSVEVIISPKCSQILLKNQLIAVRTFTEGSLYIFSKFSILGIKILWKLGLSGPSMMVPSDIIAAYLFFQFGERMFYLTNSTT